MDETKKFPDKKVLAKRCWIVLFVLGFVSPMLFLATRFMFALYGGDWCLYGTYEGGNWAFNISLATGIIVPFLAIIVTSLNELRLLWYSVVLLLINLPVLTYNFWVLTAWSC